MGQRRRTFVGTHLFGILHELSLNAYICIQPTYTHRLIGWIRSCCGGCRLCCSLGGRQALFSGFAPGAVHMGVGQTRMTEWGADVMMNQKLGRFACPPFLAKRGSHQDSPIPHSAAVPPPSLGHLVPTPSAIGLFNSKLPPGPPKKGGRLFLWQVG